MSKKLFLKFWDVFKIQWKTGGQISLLIHQKGLFIGRFGILKFGFLTNYVTRMKDVLSRLNKFFYIQESDDRSNARAVRSLAEDLFI